MTPPTTPSWKLPAALAAALCTGAALGWLADGRLATGIAVVAVAEVVLLLTRIRHQARAMMAAPTAVSPLQHDRFMTRSRRIASSLRDLRNAAGQLPDAVVLLDRQQQIRWFNHAAENLLGLRRPDDRGASLQQRLAGSELAGWLRDGAREPLTDAAAPGRADSQLNVSLLPFGDHEQLLLAHDISHLNRLEQVLARAEWDDPAMAEGLVCDTHGNAISATAANLFAVIDGNVVTPGVERCGVAGVMRAEVLAALRHDLPTLQPASAVILDGVCPYLGPAIVFEANWDLAGALQLFYRDVSLQADVVTTRMRIEEDGLVTSIYGMESRYPYEQILLFDYARRTSHRLRDAGEARDHFRTRNPDLDNGCPPGHEGVGAAAF